MIEHEAASQPVGRPPAPDADSSEGPGPTTPTGSPSEAGGSRDSLAPPGQAARTPAAERTLEIRVPLDRRFFATVGTGLALLAILAVGAWLRFSHVNWDEGQHLHPDERFLTMVGTAIQVPTSLAQYFDTQKSSLNPYNRGYNSFVYGTYPLFLTRVLADPLKAEGYDRIHLLGRTLSAAHDLGTLLLVFLIARHLYGRRVALAATLLLAFTALHIQQAHFFTVDSYLVFYLSLAFYATLRALDSRAPGWYVLAGLGLGLATASKINALLFVLVLATAVALEWLRGRARPLPSERGWPPLVGSLAAMLVCLAVFRVAQPYAFLGPSPLDVLPNPVWLNDLSSWQRIASGEADYPPSHQWAFTTPYLFPLRHMVLWGLGLPLGLAALGGVALVSARLLARWPRYLAGPLARQESLRASLARLGDEVAPVSIDAQRLEGELAFTAGELSGDGEAPRALAKQLAVEWRRYRGEALMLVWVLANFLYWGQQMAKTMRYFLPIYPFLAILGAYVGWWLLDAGLGRWRSQRTAGQSPVLPAARSRLVVGLLGLPLALVAAGTMFYGLAFSTIYSRPVTRVAASEWIYQNIPPGAAIAWEHWDDPLPLRLPGRDPGIYRSQQLTLYDDDNVSKREKLIATLNQVDYIFLSSNRLYGSIPRLPMRYPLTTEYYRLLFSGNLGFELVRSFSSHPTLLSISINDDDAEEAFTVYDHPRVLIYRKTADYSPERVQRLLSSVDLDHVVRVRPTQAGTNGLLLSPAERERQEQSGTWSELFDRASLPNQYPVLAWLMALQVLALAAFPLAWRLLGRLSDGGYLFSKLLGLLAVSYLGWLLASLRLAEFSRASLMVATLLLGLLSALVLRDRGGELAGFLGRRWRLLAFEEGLFLLAFLAFLLVRAANPDLWHAHFGGEKPMDYAYLNAVIKSAFFPPYDPWLAGGYINYYYYGFVIVATLVKLSGIVPWVAYNLAIPLLFALTVGLAFSFGHSLLSGQERWARWPQRATVGAGLLAAALVAVLGNLDALAQVADGLGKLGGLGFQSRLPGLAGLVNGLAGLRALAGGGRSLPPFDFWRSTRVIGPEDPGPISEFPFFTFLYGDLHAHMIALPITLSVILVGLAVLREARAGSFQLDWQPGVGPRKLALGLARTPWPWLLALVAWLVGMLRATNTWDFPTYAALALAAFGLAHYGLERSLNLRWLVWTGAAAVGLVVASSAFFQPYLTRYALFYTGVDPVKQATALHQYLTIFGGFLLLVGGLAAVESWRVVRRAAYPLAAEAAVAAPRYHAGLAGPAWLERLGLPALPSLWLLFLAAALTLAGKHTAAFLAAALALVAFHFLRPRLALESRYLWAMVGLALALTLLPELLALKGDVGRMNTVFKFYLQAWVMLALVAAVAVFMVDRRLRQLSEAGAAASRAWRVGVGLLLAALALYPLLATPVKVGLRFQPLPPTLDGMAYMERAEYSDAGRPLPLRPDLEAINWLLDHVRGTPTIVEAVTPLYRWGSRVSIYTGLPTVLGWDWHQKQQRGDFGSMVDERAQQVRAFFETTSPAQARQFLERYRVRYVYVGPVERLYYPPQGLAKFEQMVGNGLSVAYRSEGVTIYRVEGT